MSSQSRLEDGAVVALAGRRIDAIDTSPPRFPLEAVPTVRRRLADLLSKERTVALVCSAACGADLVALEEAERLGLRRRIVLPFPPERFRKTSVAYRLGDWGPVFDRLVGAAEATGDLIVLSAVSGSDDAAYASVNEAIVREAQAIAQDSSKYRLIAVVVWEGAARPEGDATAQFRELAAKTGFDERYILLCRCQAKNYLKGGAAHAPVDATARPWPPFRVFFAAPSHNGDKGDA